MKKVFSAALFLSLFFMGANAYARQNASSASREPMLVSVAWLGEHRNDPALVLLQIGEKSDYEKEHIPGAHYLNYEDISTPHGQGLMLELPPAEQLVSVFEELGVSNSSHVILYFGKDWVTPATRVYWTLDYLGLGDRVSILDGGLPAWRAAGKSVTAEVKQPQRGSITPALHKEIVADSAWVSGHLNRPGVTIIDARAKEFYTGSKGDGTPSSGHIPGATNLSYLDVVDEKTKEFKSPDALADLFRAAGLKPGNLMVSYCHIGQRATALYFTAKMLGYKAKMYDGSWEDWSQHKDLPIVQGDQPGKP